MEAEHPEDPHLKSLQALRLSFGPSLQNNILNKLKEFEDLNLPIPMDELSIWAVAAIVCHDKLPTLNGGNQMASIGLPVERFLNHIPSHQRYPLILRIELITQTWGRDDGSFRLRLCYVILEYNQFLDYQNMFLKLSGEVTEHLPLLVSHFKLIWLVFVEIKQSEKIQQLWQQRQILAGLIRSFFGERPYQFSERVYGKICSTFLKGSVLEEKDQKISSQMMQKVMMDVFTAREDKGTLEQLMIRLSQDGFLPRYMDDFFISIADKHRKLGNQRVDATLFLDLDKTLPPLQIKKKDIWIIQQFGFSSSDSNHDSDNEGNGSDDEEPEDEKGNLSRIGNRRDQDCGKEQAKKEEMQGEKTVTRVEPTKAAIPAYSRAQTLNWMRLGTPLSKGPTMRQFSIIFQKVTGEDYSDVKAMISEKVQRMIVRCSPECRNVEKRGRKIIGLFNLVIQNLYAKESSQILEDPSRLHAYLWLSTVLLSQVHRANKSSLLDSVEVFGLTVQEAILSVKWVFKNVTLPSHAKNYLLGVQRNLERPTAMESEVQMEKRGSGQCLQAGTRICSDQPSPDHSLKFRE